MLMLLAKQVLVQMLKACLQGGSQSHWDHSMSAVSWRKADADVERCLCADVDSKLMLMQVCGDSQKNWPGLGLAWRKTDADADVCGDAWKNWTGPALGYQLIPRCWQKLWRKTDADADVCGDAQKNWPELASLGLSAYTQVLTKILKKKRCWCWCRCLWWCMEELTRASLGLSAYLQVLTKVLKKKLCWCWCWCLWWCREELTRAGQPWAISHYRESTDRVYTDDCIWLQQRTRMSGKSEHATQMRGEHMIQIQIQIKIKTQIWIKTQIKIKPECYKKHRYKQKIKYKN